MDPNLNHLCKQSLRNTTRINKPTESYSGSCVKLCGVYVCLYACMHQKPVDFGFCVPSSHLVVVIGFLPVSFDRGSFLLSRCNLSPSLSLSFHVLTDIINKTASITMTERSTQSLHPFCSFKHFFIAFAFKHQHVFFCSLGVGLSDGPDDVRGGSVR